MSTTSAPSPVDGEEMDQDVELNIASIVDCFTVLITYVLAAASFISIGALEAGLAQSTSATSSGSAATEKQSVFLSMELMDNRTVRIRSVGTESEAYIFPPKADGAWDFESAVGQLKRIKTKYPEVNSLTLLSDNAIQYRDIIGAVSATKKELPVFFVKTESIL